MIHLSEVFRKLTIALCFACICAQVLVGQVTALPVVSSCCNTITDFLSFKVIADRTSVKAKRIDKL